MKERIEIMRMNDTAKEIVAMISEYIKSLEESDLTDYPKGIAKTALNTAVNLIKKQFGIEEKIEYIKKSQLLDLIESLTKYVTSEHPWGKSNLTTVEVNSLISGINRIPPSNVIEVVHCKDCTYCEDTGVSGLYCNHSDHRNPIYCLPSDYCNNGEYKKK